MEIKFKELNADNLFDCCLVLEALGAEQILDVFNKDNLNAIIGGNKDASSIGVVVGMKICGIVIKYLPKAREEIYTFLSNCTVFEDGSSVSVDDLRNMKISKFAKLVMDFFKQDDLSDFFEEVVKFMGMEEASSQS